MLRRLSVCGMLGMMLLAGCRHDEGDHTDMATRGILQGPTVVQPGPGPGRVAPPVRQQVKPSVPEAKPEYRPGPSYAGVPRSWVPKARARDWQWIVIHHSDTEVGSAGSFDRYHREVHHWKSLGYDFVIGNGHGSGDGEVEVGPRWVQQDVGAHAGVLEFNERGIGICLVGDFQTGRPTAAQLRSLAKLNGFLMKRYGIRPDHIIGHRDAKKTTNCPGRNLSVASVRSMAMRVAATEDSMLEGALAEGFVGGVFEP